MCLLPHKACVCAAAWSILQSILHLGWCIWGISLYNCAGEVQHQTFTYFWYLTYFYRKECTNVTFDFTVLPVRSLNDTSLLEPVGGQLVWDNSSEGDFAFSPFYGYKQTIQFPTESAAANRTNLFLIVYSGVNCLWMITAVILLCGTGLRITDCAAIIFYFPWVLVLFCILFLDMIAGCWYLYDVPRTYGLTKWFLFIGAENQTIFSELEKKNSPESSMMPSILMCLLFTRFLFIWCINLFYFFRISRIGMDMVNGRVYDDESKTSNQGHLDHSNVASTHRPRDFQVTAARTNSTSVRIRRWQMYYGTDDEEEECVERTHRRRRSRQKSVTVNEGWHKSNAFQYNQAAVTGQKLAVIGGYEGDRSNSPSPLPESSQKVYSSGYESNDYHASASGQRSSVQSSIGDREVCQVNQKPTTSCVSELRSQLPWSYFQDRNEVVLPKCHKRQDDMPPIPIPDYTLKFSDKTKNKTGVL